MSINSQIFTNNITKMVFETMIETGFLKNASKFDLSFGVPSVKFIKIPTIDFAYYDICVEKVIDKLDKENLYDKSKNAYKGPPVIRWEDKTLWSDCEKYLNNLLKKKGVYFIINATVKNNTARLLEIYKQDIIVFYKLNIENEDYIKNPIKISIVSAEYEHTIISNKTDLTNFSFNKQIYRYNENGVAVINIENKDDESCICIDKKITKEYSLRQFMNDSKMVRDDIKKCREYVYFFVKSGSSDNFEVLKQNFDIFQTDDDELDVEFQIKCRGLK